MHPKRLPPFFPTFPTFPAFPSFPAFCTSALVAASALFGSCGDERTSRPTPNASDRVAINSDSLDLSAYVAVSGVPVPIQRVGLINGLAFVPDEPYTLTVVAEVAPPQIDGVDLQATAIAFDGNRALVSYNTAGDAKHGAIDVFELDGARNLKLTSRATFDDTDVSAVAASGGRVWLATATGDASFGTPAVLEGLSLAGDGTLTLDDHIRVGLSSFAATSVAVGEGRVFATSGNGGGVHVFDPASGTITAASKIADARWVAAPGDGTVVVVRGTPGRLEVLDARDLSPIDEYPFDGAQVPESKSTVQVVGGKAFIAAGPGGAIVIDLATGRQLARIAPPTGLPLAPSEVVTNAVTVDGKLMFVSNGAAGVYLVASPVSFATPPDPKVPTAQLEQVGRLVFPGEIASVNHITYQNGYLFVASGRGGLKIVKVEDGTPEIVVPNGYPYVSGFGDESARAGWKLEGDWGWGVPDGLRQGVSGAFLDNNPSLFDQAGLAGDVATLELPLAIPVAGAPTLSFAYSADFLSADDVVEVQVSRGEDSEWKTVMTLQVENERAQSARRNFGLDAYRGETVRLRLVQRMGAVSGVRRFTVDDLSVGPRALPTLGYPFETSFESTFDRSQWNLEGTWSWSTSDAFDGTTQLDVNPEALDLASYDKGQQAELLGYIPVPTGGTPVVGFWYRSDLLPGGDVVVVAAQIEGQGSWADLTSFKPAHDSEQAWAYREVSLADYRGQRVRLRFGFAFSATAGARTFVIDGLRVGPLLAGEAAYPYSNDFETPLAADGWLAQGALSVGAREDAGHAIVSDPAALAERGEGFATMIDFVTLPTEGTIQLAFDAALELVADDVLVIEAQRRGEAAWTTVTSFGARQSHSGWSRYEIPLDDQHGQSLRLRFRASFGATAGHGVAIDNVALDGLPATRFAYPFAAEFDAASLASWIVNGAWTPVDGMIDANPGRFAQGGWGPGQELAMPGYVAVPATGRPTLFVSLDLGFTDQDDRLYLEVQTSDDGAWTTVRSYDSRVNRGGFGWDELPLDAWAGKEIRLRLRYALGGSPTPRRMRVGDLRIEDLVPQHYGAPWANGCDKAADVTQWSLWGAWSADGKLDGNPDGAIQSGWNELQTATTVGDIAVPFDRTAFLGFKHHFGAVRADDALDVQVQPNDSSTWTTLATLNRQHVRPGMSTVELPLDAWAGRSIRVRFSLRLGASDAVRDIAIDDAWVGQLALADAPAPITSDFGTAGAGANWSLSGLWQVTGDRLAFNPAGVDTAGFATFQTATYESFVRVGESQTVSLRYHLALTDAADRAYIEVLRPGSTRWTAIAAFDHNDNSVQAEATFGFEGVESVRVRLRVESAQSSGARQFAVRWITVGQ